MPERTLDPGHYGARGVRASNAARARLDELAGGISSPVTTDRGLHARLRYLTASQAGYQAMEQAGIHVQPRTLTGWLAEEHTPTAANLQRIDAAYRALRRENVARHLTQRLNAGGGTRVELHPLDQSGVQRRHQRIVPHRRMTIRRWDHLVSAWAAGDGEQFAQLWDGHLTDLGSQWGQYEYVTAVGFGA
jgi:hypothetical protein